MWIVVLKKREWKDMSFQIEKVHWMKTKLYLGQLFASSWNFKTLEIKRSILTETVETRQQWSNFIEILMKLFPTKKPISSQNVNQT